MNDLTPFQTQYYTTDTATNKSKRFMQMVSNNQIHPTAIIGNNVRIGKGNKIAWNKGLKKETDTRVRKNAENISKTIRKKMRSGTFTPNRMGDEAKKKLSIKQSLCNSGGKCKWFEVSGQMVQGTWERNLAILMSFLEISWTKLKVNKDVIVYKFKENEKRYTPDFYLPELDRFLELKGYWWGDDQEKMKAIFEQHPEFEKKCVIIRKKLYNELLECKTKEDFYGTLV